MGRNASPLADVSHYSACLGGKVGREENAQEDQSETCVCVQKRNKCASTHSHTMCCGSIRLRNDIIA